MPASLPAMAQPGASATFVAPPETAAFVGKFRPSSREDFSQYAKNLSRILGLGLQKSQETLARIYGYANLHELQKTMQVAGTPGPFENEQSPLGFAPVNVLDGFTPSASRIVRVMSAMAGNADTPVLRHRVELARLLGLFTTPDVHKRRFHVVKACLDALENQACPPALAQLLLGYHYDWAFDSRALDRFGMARQGGTDRQGGTTFVPQAQLDALLRFHGVRQSLQYPGTIRHPALIAATQGSRAVLDTWDGLCPLDAAFAQYCAERGAYALVESAYPDIPFDEPPFEIDLTGIKRFILTQDVAVVPGHPVLGKIDDPTLFATEWMRECRNEAAREHLEDLHHTQAVLRSSHVLPDDQSFNGARQLEIAVHLSPSKAISCEKPGALTLWDYSATLSTLDGHRRTLTPVALMQGILIVPFRGGAAPARRAEFEEALGDHSAGLGRLATLLQDGFFYDNGYRDVEDYCLRHPGNGLLQVELELVAELQGQPFNTQLALKMLVDAFRSAPSSHWSAAFPDAADRGQYGIHAVYGELCLAAPGVLILEQDNRFAHEPVRALEEQLGLPVVAYATGTRHAL